LVRYNFSPGKKAHPIHRIRVKTVDLHEETGSMQKISTRFLIGLSLGIATLAATAGISGCHSVTPPASIPNNSGPDPADANMAPVDGSQQAAPAPARVLGIRSQAQPQQSAEQYAPQAAPPPNEAIAAAQTAQPDQNYDYNAPDPDADAGQQALEEADQPPPPLPDYEQPEAPAPNYLWTPGYWGWAPLGYYWVPGAWCAPPYYGGLWTPGYWGFYNNRYLFHRGYWGMHIGFYGGINYGFGYTGVGYHGGYWNGNNFYYNRAVNRINVTRITNVYNRTVIVNNNTRVAYNGGRGGLAFRPQAAEVAAMRGPRTPPMSTQIQNQREASQNRQQFFSQNKGRPAMVAASRPIMADRGVQRPQVRPSPGVQPGNRPGVTRPGETNNRPQVQPTRPGQPGLAEGRPGQPQTRPVQPENRPGQPQTRPVQPENRPAQPQVRPTQPQVRPAQPQTRPAQPQVRPQPQQPQPRPEQQPQVRPAQPQTRPMPQPEQRPAQQARPAQQSRPAPQARPAARPAPRQENPK
jgi:hypothetical protein